MSKLLKGASGKICDICVLYLLILFIYRVELVFNEGIHKTPTSSIQTTSNNSPTRLNLARTNKRHLQVDSNQFTTSKVDGEKLRKSRRQLTSQNSHDYDYQTARDLLSLLDAHAQENTTGDLQLVQDFAKLPNYPQLPGSVAEPAERRSSSEEDDNSTLLAQIESDIEKLVRSQLDLAASDWAKGATPAQPEAGSVINHTDDFSLIDRNYSSLIDQASYEDFFNHVTKSQASQGEENNENFVEVGANNKLYPNHNYRVPAEQPEAGHRGASSAPQDPLSTSSDGSTVYASTELYSAGNQQQQTTTPAPANYQNRNHHLANQLISKYMYRLRGPITSSLQQQLFTNRKLAAAAADKLAAHSTTLAPNIVRAFERLDRMRQAGSAGHQLGDASELKPAHEPAMAGKINSNGFIDVVVGGGGEHSNGQQAEISNKGKLPADYGKRPAGNLQNKLQWSAAGSTLSTGDNNATKLTSSPPTTDPERGFKFSQTNSGAVKLPAPVRQQGGEFHQELNNSLSLAARLNANRNKNRMRGPSNGSPAAKSPAQANKQPVEALTLNLESLLANGRLKPNLLEPSTQPVQYYTRQFVRPILRSTTTTMKPLSGGPVVANLAPALYAAAMNNLAKSRQLQPTTAASTTASTAKSPEPEGVTIAASPSTSGQLRLPSAQHHHLHSHIHSIKPAAVLSIPVPVQPKLLGAGSLLVAAAGSGPSASGGGPVSGARMRQLHLPAHRKYHLLSSIPIGGTLASSKRLVEKQNKLQTSKRANLPPASKDAKSSLLSNLIDSANKALKQVVYKNGERAPPSERDNRGTNQRGGGTNWLQQQPLVFQASQQEHSYEQAEPHLQLDTISLYQPAAQLDESSPIEGYLADLVAAAKQTGDSSQESLEQQLLLQEARPILLPVLPQLTNYPQTLKGSASSKQFYLNPLIDWDTNSSFSLDRPAAAADDDGLIFASLGDDSNFLYPILASSQSASGATGGPLQGFNQQGASGEQSSLVSAYDSPDWPALASFADDNQDEEPARQQQQSASNSSGSNRAHGSRPAKSSRNKTMPDDNPGWHRAKLGSINSINPMNSNSAMAYALSHYADEQPLEPPPGSYKQPKGSSLHYDLFDDKSNGRLPAAPPLNLYSTSGGNSADGFQPISELSFYRPVKPAQPVKAPEEHSEKLLVPEGKGNNKPAGLKYDTKPVAYKTNALYQPPIQPTHIIQFHYPSLAGNQQSPVQQQSSAGSALKPHLLAASDLINYHKQQLIDNHFLAHHYNPNVMQKARQLPLLPGQHHQLQHHPRDMATSETAQFPVASLGRASLLAHHFWPLALALLPIMIIVAIVAQLVMAAPLVLFAITTLTVSRFAALLSGFPMNSRELAHLMDPSASRNSTSLLEKVDTLMWQPAFIRTSNFSTLAPGPSIATSESSGSSRASTQKPASIRRRAPRIRKRRR